VKRYVVVEGPADLSLLERVVEVRRTSFPFPDTTVQFVAAGGRSAVASMARSLLVSRPDPVAVVMDADTLDERTIREHEEIYYDLLRSVAHNTPFRLFFAAPELEVVFFTDPAIIRRVFHRDLSEGELDVARSRPKVVLQRLLPNVDVMTRAQLATILDAETVRKIAEHPLLIALIDFLGHPKTWKPA
jgi:hypothetical protein